MKGASVATEDEQQGENTGEQSAPPVGEPGQPGEHSGEEQDTFPREYVERLRQEAAEHRTKAKRAEDAEDRLRALAIAEAARGVLTDPSDLPWSDDLADSDGWPDSEKIRAAADELVTRKPYLARPAGDVGQGRHSSADDAVSLAALLKAGA